MYRYGICLLWKWQYRGWCSEYGDVAGGYTSAGRTRHRRSEAAWSCPLLARSSRRSPRRESSASFRIRFASFRMSFRSPSVRIAPTGLPMVAGRIRSDVIRIQFDPNRTGDDPSGPGRSTPEHALQQQARSCRVRGLPWRKDGRRRPRVIRTSPSPFGCGTAGPAIGRTVPVCHGASTCTSTTYA
jgi:hypothetical protein